MLADGLVVPSRRPVQQRYWEARAMEAPGKEGGGRRCWPTNGGKCPPIHPAVHLAPLYLRRSCQSGPQYLKSVCTHVTSKWPMPVTVKGRHPNDNDHVHVHHRRKYIGSPVRLN